MRVRIWNAYASNNSGSYTIVGRLPSEEVAREVAEELKAMIEAHTAWHETVRGQADGSDSPLAQFCRTHGLSWRAGQGGGDEWPEHSRDNRPRVVAIGSQVVLHHDYTVSLPPTFGEFFYKKGGRVAHEENHAHHPIVTIASFWWGWRKEQLAQMEVELPRLVTTLTAPDGLLMQDPPTRWPAAWRAGGREEPLIAGVIFEDLIEGVSALNAVAGKHGARMHLRLYEASDEDHDPFAHLRPSSPPPAVPRFDIVVSNAGDHHAAVVDAICETLGLQEWNVREQLMDLPVTLARSLPKQRAEAAAAEIRRTGAAVDIVRNDG